MNIFLMKYCNFSTCASSFGHLWLLLDEISVQANNLNKYIVMLLNIGIKFILPNVMNKKIHKSSCTWTVLWIQTSEDVCCSNGGDSRLLSLHDMPWLAWMVENLDPDIGHFDLVFLLPLYFFNLTQYLPASSNEHHIVIKAVTKITLLQMTRPETVKVAKDNKLRPKMYNNPLTFAHFFNKWLVL